MGLVRDVAGAAIGAAFPGAGAAVAGGRGKKRSNGGSTDSDDPGAPGQGASDSSSSDAGSDGGFGSYAKRFGQNLARNYSQPKRS